MRPLLHPSLVNGRFGDPVLFLETLFEKRAILFDLGDISALPPRKIQRIEQVFVSHTHIDHFVGFDRLLRILVGREKTMCLYGPPGFIQHVHHKLQAYQWNLVDRYVCELIFVVTEIDASCETRTARFRLKTAFACEEVGHGCVESAIVYSEPTFQVSTAVLDHRIPCLAYAIKEAEHVNIWKNRLAAMELPVGPWLHELKRAVIEQRADDHLIHIGGPSQSNPSRVMPLGALREVLTVTPGQKIVYVTDAADTPANRDAIVRFALDADVLFIEAKFSEADAALAAERAHLTTTAAGHIARAARVRHVEPFHFSLRYEGLQDEMLAEVTAAFAEKDVAKRRDDALAP
ncbi:MAG: ribonuclease Z [Beijerinckiaceae bacterium]